MSAALCTWDASPTAPVDGYNVYLRKDSVYGKANTSLINALEYKLTNLSPGTYSAYETAVKGQNESEPSNIATFTIAFGNNYKPTGLQSTVLDEEAGDVDFSWDYVPGITQFNMYLEVGGSYVKQNSSPLNAPEISLSGLSPGSYNWYVSALYDGSEIDSNVESFSFQGAVPENTQAANFSTNSSTYAQETDLEIADLGNTFTIFASVKFNAIDPSGTTGLFGVHDPTNDARCYVALNEADDGNWALGFGGSFTIADPEHLPKAGEKYFIAAAFDYSANTAKLFVNGVEVISVSGGTNNLANYLFTIGARNAEGTIDGSRVDCDISYMAVIQDYLSLSETTALFDDFEELVGHTDAFRFWAFESDLSSTEDDYVNSATLTYNGSVAVASVVDNYFFEGTHARDSLTVGSGETLDIYGKVVINVSGNVQIDGTIDGNGRGHQQFVTTSYADGEGPGFGVGQSNDGGTGASYGGLGGTAPDAFSSVTAVYGSETSQDIEKGSSGANGDDDAIGGNGGAALYINASGDISISGTAVISMNGEDGADSTGQRGGGGGSGGGIGFEAVDITISSGAVLRANGAIGGRSGNVDPENDNGGAGGGGRQKYFYTGTFTNNGTLEVLGGDITSVYPSADPRCDGSDGTTHSEDIS